MHRFFLHYLPGRYVQSSMLKPMGVAVGEEARFRKKDMMLGPGLNIYRSPLNGRNFEYMGEDPVLTGTLAVPYIQGVQRSGVASCVKHFALNKPRGPSRPISMCKSVIVP